MTIDVDALQALDAHEAAALNANCTWTCGPMSCLGFSCAYTCDVSCGGTAAAE